MRGKIIGAKMERICVFPLFGTQEKRGEERKLVGPQRWIENRTWIVWWDKFPGKRKKWGERECDEMNLFIFPIQQSNSFHSFSTTHRKKTLLLLLFWDHFFFSFSFLPFSFHIQTKMRGSKCCGLWFPDCWLCFPYVDFPL